MKTIICNSYFEKRYLKALTKENNLIRYIFFSKIFIFNGIDLKNRPGVTPAQLKMCQGCNIRTVEDLAESNADSIRKMGMGGVRVTTGGLYS